jgi:hypothetical protein
MSALVALPRFSIFGIVASPARLNLGDGRAESPILDLMRDNSKQITSLRRFSRCNMSEPGAL